MKSKINYKLPLSILGTLLLGSSGSFFTATSVNSWYSTINKPSFNPPNWLFGPVWTILFILMGISLYLIWNSDSARKNTAIVLFILQMILNVLWSYLFFGLCSPELAMIDILTLWVMIIICMIHFFPINKWATYLFIPYLLWVSFASILNGTIAYLN